jgi:hypothetical protein
VQALTSREDPSDLPAEPRTPVGRDEQRDVVADRLEIGITEQFLGGDIPRSEDGAPRSARR